MYLIIPFLILLFSCGGESEIELPADVLAEDKMIPILIEIHLADAILDNKKFKKDSTVQYARVMHENIYKQHGTTVQAFDASMVFYKKNPKRFEAMYVELLKQMSIREAKVGKIQKK